MSEHRVHAFRLAPPEFRLLGAIGIVVVAAVLAWRGRHNGLSHVERATGSLIVLVAGVGLGLHQPHDAWTPTVAIIGLGVGALCATGLEYARAVGRDLAIVDWRGAS